MIAFGSVPFYNSRNTSIWLACVPSTADWQAATPLPGTTTACTPGRNMSSPLTHVAEAMTTRPVLRSTARHGSSTLPADVDPLGASERLAQQVQQMVGG